MEDGRVSVLASCWWKSRTCWKIIGGRSGLLTMVLFSIERYIARGMLAAMRQERGSSMLLFATALEGIVVLVRMFALGMHASRSKALVVGDVAVVLFALFMDSEGLSGL